MVACRNVPCAWRWCATPWSLRRLPPWARGLCYAGGDVDELLTLVNEKDQRAFVERVMGMGHESVLEHASFTFLAEGVSRVLLAQLTRHRIASFSVQSQRYVSYARGFGYIIPPAIRALGPGGR